MKKQALNKILHFTANLLTHICLFGIALALMSGCHSERNKQAFEALEKGAYKEVHAKEYNQRNQ